MKPSPGGTRLENMDQWTFYCGAGDGDRKDDGFLLPVCFGEGLVLGDF